MSSRSLRTMKAEKVDYSVDLPDRVESCSHDEAYRVGRTQTFGGHRHCTCGNCGAGLWIVGGTVLVAVKKSKVIDFTYSCVGCDAVFEYPSGAVGHECDS